MEYVKRKHNTLITTVIKRYLNKEGGRVKASRYEIEWRFDALDWKYQKRILFAFLESGKLDRNWAYDKLFVFWDDCFIPILKGLWERYHEETLSRLIIRYFPIEFLKSNYDSLNVGRNYYYLCTRLYDTSNFIVDRNRLNELELLKIKRLLKEPTTLGDAKDMFFYMIYKYCKGVYKFRAWRMVENYKSGDGFALTILNRPMINKMLAEIGDIEPKGYVLILELLEWRETVTKDFIAKFGMIGDMLHDEAEERMRHAQMTHCYKHIDREYTSVWDTFDVNDQQQFLDYMEERHRLHIIEEMANKDERWCLV